MKLTGGALASVLAACSLAQASSSPPITVEAQAELSPKYIWRGINLVNDWVLQPSVTLTRGGWTAALWGNLEVTNWNLDNYSRAPRGRFTELDFSLDWSGGLGPLFLSAGVLDSQFPGVGFPRYQELRGSASLEEAWGSPSLTLSSGLNSRTGTLAILGMSWSLPLSNATAKGLDLSMELGLGDSRWNGYWHGHAKEGPADLLLRAEAPFELADGWVLTPALNWSTLLNDKLSEGAPRRTNFWVSLSVGWKF